HPAAQRPEPEPARRAGAGDLRDHHARGDRADGGDARARARTCRARGPVESRRRADRRAAPVAALGGRGDLQSRGLHALFLCAARRHRLDPAAGGGSPSLRHHAARAMAARQRAGGSLCPPDHGQGRGRVPGSAGVAGPVRIVWHCEDVVGARMAGPGIRAVELSRRLSARHEVTLVAAGAEELRGEPFRTAPDLGQALEGADVFVAQGFGFPMPHLLRFRGRLVLDLYDPVQLEQLARMGANATAEQIVEVGYVRRRLQYLVRRADHVLCASRPQRAHWLGWMGACGRLSPRALAGDPEAARLVAVVPFGLPEQPPARDGTPLRSAIRASGEDRVDFWAGGLWDWMD